MAETALESSELTINVGSRVRVNWLEEWYEGIVMDIVPQKDLYSVLETQSQLPIILHISQMKSIDKTRSSHEKFQLGAEIAYYDSSLGEWLGGVIEAIDVEASILVKWRRGKDQGDNVNWFKEDDIALIIENKAFKIEEEREEEEIDYDPEPHRSAPIIPEIIVIPNLEDILEEKPVFRRNEVFEENTVTQKNNSIDNHLPDIEQFVQETTTPLRPSKRRTSVSMKEFYAKRFQKPPNKKSKTNGLHDYLENQHALLQGKLDHSALPAVWTYLDSMSGRGIPHHPASRFFSQYESQMKRTQSSTLTAFRLSRSPTIVTRPESEPGDTRHQNPLKKLKNRKMKRQMTNMSIRPLPPLPGSPYEVPLSTSTSKIHNQPNPLVAVSKDSSGSSIYERVVTTTSDGPKPFKGLMITAASPKKQIVTAGGSVMLFCEAESTTPITYEWYKDGKKLTHSDDQVAFPGPGKLQLYGLNLQSAGKYQCRVTNTAKQCEMFDCILKVDNETIKKSFSRELGLHNLAVDNAATVNDKGTEQQQTTSKLLSLQKFAVSESDLERAPLYDIHPFSFIKSPSTMDLAKESLDKDIKRLEEEGRKETEKQLHSAQASKSTIDDRKTHKEKRRRSSNTIIIGMDNYLDGYGEDYGESAHILEVPMTVGKKIKADKKKNKSKKEKKLKHNDDDGSGKKKKSKKSAKKLKKEEETLDREKTPEEIDSPINFEVEVGEVKTNNDITVETEQTEAQSFEQKPPLFDEEDEKKLLAAKMANGHDDEPLSKYGIMSRVSNHVSQSNDSIDALPEYESLTSVSSDFDRLEKPDSESKKGSSNVNLPLASEHYTESIKRLQKSSEEYEEEHFGGKEKKKDSKGLLRKMLKSNNSKLE